jgi:DNA polymerase III delta subunit
VLGKGSAQFSRDWLPDMIVPELSLFSLSQALFDRKPSSFFKLWKQFSQKYSVPFWITFWSEQLWRAYCYVRLQKNGKEAEAKKIGYRLPFSFLNRSWRNYTLEELKTYHHLLYEIDYQVKNGGSAYALDLFYATMLLQSA